MGQTDRQRKYAALAIREDGTRGPVNLRPSIVQACVFYSLIG